MFQYIVRVKDKVYVWGSNDFKGSSSLPLVLIMNNDPHGDHVEVSSESSTGVTTPLGTLQPGQCWSLPLSGLRAVVATCTTDTTLACAISFPG